MPPTMTTRYNDLRSRLDLQDLEQCCRDCLTAVVDGDYERRVKRRSEKVHKSTAPVKRSYNNTYCQSFQDQSIAHLREDRMLKLSRVCCPSN